MGDPEPIIISVSCAIVVIYENGQVATTDYRVMAPNSASPAVLRPAGAKTEFRAPWGSMFREGQTIGYVETVSGTVTFAQEED